MTPTMAEQEQHEFVKLELRTAYGPVFRDVSTKPSREATPEEIPVIDLSTINGTFQERKQLSELVRSAAEDIGFFYIRNHGISYQVIDDACGAAARFFNQPLEEKKMKVSKNRSKHFDGYHAQGTSKVSRTEGIDLREALMWSYALEYDPETKDIGSIPLDVKAWLRGEEFVSEFPDFDTLLTYWQECLKLSRKLIRIFALALDLPEGYFDPVTTFPGADGVLNWYPGLRSIEEAQQSGNTQNLGCHTDLQIFTLLFQSGHEGLQVLNNQGRWNKASPIEGTFVVNIGDFLMRLTNDRMKSTVHRVSSRSTQDRLSMPFFFGFNFNEKCSVLPSCISKDNPAKYEPVSCGEWCELRFKQADPEISMAVV